MTNQSNNNWDNFDLDEDFNTSWDVDSDFEEIVLDLDDAEVKKPEAKSAAAERPAAAPARPAAAEKPAVQRPVRHITPNRDADEETVKPAARRKQPVVSEEKKKRGTAGRSSAKKKKSSSGKKILLLVLAVLLVAAVAFLLAKLIGKGGKKPVETAAPAVTASAPAETQPQEPETAAWSDENENEAILSLVNRYYAACSQLDMVSLEQILDPGIPVSESRYKSLAEDTEGYRDIFCYTTDGMKEGEWAVYIRYQMKMKDISTPIPGLVPAYVRTDADGNLRLIIHEVMKSGYPEVYSYLNEVSQCDKISELGQVMKAQYQAALDSDEALKEYIKSIQPAETQPAETQPGETQPAETEPGETQPAETEPGETQPAETEPGEAQPAENSGEGTEDTFTTTDDTMYTNNKVKCRFKPNTSDDTEFVVLEPGTAVQVTGIGSGDWNRVTLRDGTKGYIMKQYLSAEQPANN